jgi:hypothetical protein
VAVSRTIVVVIAAASCGRLGFDDRAAAIDTGVPNGSDGSDAPPPMPMLVGSASLGANGMGATIAIAPVTAGDLLVVAITAWDGTAVASVTDASGTALTSAGARAVMTSTSSELWYAAPAEATDSITVAMAGSATGIDIWAAAFSGLASGPPARIAHGCLEYPPDPVAAPVTTTQAGELVVGVEMFAYPVFVDTVLPPFTAVGDYVDGNGFAYEIAAEPGSDAPAWAIGSGAGMSAMTCASTAAWLPTP